jgi:hypothetical protein
MSSDNIDGYLLSESILDRYEAAVKKSAQQEDKINSLNGEIWGLKNDLKRAENQRDAERAAKFQAESERDAFKAQAEGSKDEVDF